ncbi:MULTISPECIES: GGDEF domain-containing protein [unclassified Halomonas]|uniref:GGDEF domain-containing protein n=1 Tax=unclassified Halomonas TaxID=2609666 RepID=UPI0007DA3362|nr:MULTISPECIES: GGDEF domain-containing protein [unclassified Halomonas]MBT2786893.1 GGDEF domain-containing protein [Halomonas sp. ISL-106]MBT2798454.1 GGDEF domain-containing protein [Halomonas sp. ISL-104]OAL58169.1 diguanylate cyclase [Halomonas sp. ALS9]
MSGTLSPSVQNLDHLCHELALLCSSATPLELFELLAKTLHALTQAKPIALYRRLNTGNLRLAYCYPLESALATHHELLAIHCYDDLTASELQLYELNGEHEVWGYIGHPPADYTGPGKWIELLIDIASQRLRLLKAERMATRQLGLKSRRKLLSRDIKRLTSIDDILHHHGASWCDIFQAEGIALAYQGDLHCYGEYPSKHQLFHQLEQLNHQSTHNEIAELTGSCQGGLATHLCVANASLGWLVLFRQQPLLPALVTNTTLQDALSYWMPREASMVVELADDLAVAITALEVVHLNRQLTKSNRRLEGLAHTDPLTKCWNRYYTELVIEDLLHSSVSFAMLMFDIDDFKNINDTYGHAIGDDILCDIAQLVQQTLRADDHLGRWGGEEFVIISKELDQDASLKLANRLCRSVEQHSFPIADHITVSIGLTLLQPGDQPRQLFERADQGMYLAKMAGKNQAFVC